MQLHEHPFFAGSGDGDMSSLFNAAQIRDFEDGEIIFEEGDAGIELGLLLEGRVRLEKKIPGPDDPPMMGVLGELGEGEVFGEYSLITSSPRIVRTVSVGRCRAAFIPCVDIRGMRTVDNPITKKMDEVISRRMSVFAEQYVREMLNQDRLAALGGMVGAIAHDMRNPLAVIRGAMQCIEAECGPATLAHCHKIDRQIERMLAMLDEILDFVRGRHSEEYSRIDLRELAETFRFLNADLWTSAGIRVNFRCEKAAAEVAPRKMLRVLQNLVGNAVEALEGIPGGEIVIETAVIDAERSRIVISDNGPGIPENIRETFWMPFVTKGKKGGTGLGSAICRAIVESHKGRIVFFTETGKGTRFEIELPTQRPDFAPNETESLLQSA